MLKNKYERVLDQFELYYPSLYNQAVDWWVSGRMSITVRLKDGEMFEFDPTDNSIRRIRVNEYDEDETAIRSEFGSNLQKLISLKGMSKNELSEKLGITNAMLSRYIRGTSMPSVDKAHKLARAIGCRLEEFFDDTYME